MITFKDLTDVLFVIGGALLSIIGYFLSSSIKDIKDVIIKTNIIENRLDVVKNDYMNKYDNLTDKLDDLKTTIMTLTAAINKLNDKK